LLGFDWHSQVLHRSARWRKRWKRTPAAKLLYVQESIAGARELTGTDEMEHAFRSAAELCDAIVFTDPGDRKIVESVGRPNLWQPFGVDDRTFRSITPFDQRAPRAFFRGKVDPFGRGSEYADRRRLLEALRRLDLVDAIPYAPGPLDPDRLVADFNRYRIAVNFPSVFASHPTRVTEAMACGCCLVTNRTGNPEMDALLRDGVEVLYYRNEAELVAAVQWARDDPGTARAIAESGMNAAAERFSLTRRLSEVLAWWDSECASEEVTAHDAR
jgi:glycosyltransferase involved in cell wall biosynthesis